MVLCNVLCFNRRFINSQRDDKRASDVIASDHLQVKRPPGCVFNRFKAWHTRYCVLVRTSCDTCKLYISANHKQFTRHSCKILTINIDSETYFQVSSEASSKFSHILIIISPNEAPLVLASTDSAICRKWILLFQNIVASTVHRKSHFSDASSTILYSSINRSAAFDNQKCSSLATRNLVSSDKIGPTFTVKILPTRLSQESSILGKKDLIFGNSSIAFAAKGSNEIIIDIPMSVIRKYGASTVYKQNLRSSNHSRKDTLIEIEVGRKCETGEGEFRFFTNEGDEIIKHIRQMFLKQSACKTNSGSSKVTTATTITNGSWEREVKERAIRNSSLKETSNSIDKRRAHLHFNDDQGNSGDTADYINYQLIHESGVSEDTKSQ